MTFHFTIIAPHDRFIFKVLTGIRFTSVHCTSSVLLVVLQYGGPSTGVSAPTGPRPGEVDHAVEVPLLGCLVLHDLVLE